MMRKTWLALLLVMGGCISPAIYPARYQIGIPQANGESFIPAAVLLHNDLSQNGNTYTIQICAMTNTSSMAPGDYANDILTNRWPPRRFHLELSVDGGSNWSRRIGYGVQFDEARVECDFIWSPREDYSMLTTNAVLRAIPLEGVTWPTRYPAMPYDLPEGKVPESFPFSIGGAIITNIISGSILWQGSQTTINWIQQCAGPVMDLYWLTPTDAEVDMSHWITTISNCVDGAVNSKVISLNVPVADQVELVLISQADPRLHGYSQPFTVDP